MLIKIYLRKYKVVKDVQRQLEILKCTGIIEKIIPIFDSCHKASPFSLRIDLL